AELDRCGERVGGDQLVDRRLAQAYLAADLWQLDQDIDGHAYSSQICRYLACRWREQAVWLPWERWRLQASQTPVISLMRSTPGTLLRLIGRRRGGWVMLPPAFLLRGTGGWP